jgi:sulfate-transporting ATPase
LIAYQTTSVIYTDFASPFQSINAIALAVIGGIGFLTGPLFGSLLATGGFGGRLGETIFSDTITKYLPLVAGVSFVLMLLNDPDGLAQAHYRPVQKLRARRAARKAADVETTTAAAAPPSVPARPRANDVTLELHEVSVRYGGVVALNGVSFTLRSGAITGLIGPNGAGKTTMIDAITGFVRPSSGVLRLNGEELGRRSTTWRARAGMSRSFQSLELFDDMSVVENLLAASDPRDRLAYVTSLVRPGRHAVPDDVMAIVSDFKLENDLDRLVKDLSYAQRRLVAIARAVACRPTILLLDEPAAGLSDAESQELAQLVRRLVDQSGVAVLLVEHDMQFVMGLCDEIVVLDFGTKIAHGTPDEVRNDPAVIAAYLGDELGGHAAAPTDDELAEVVG